MADDARVFPGTPSLRLTRPQAAADALVQLTATRAHLRQVFWARNVVLGAVLLWIVFFENRMPSAWTLAILAAAILVNLVTWLRLVQASPVSHGEFFAQMLADVALIAAGLHHSGGEADSLAVLSFVPMTIAAATLPFGQVAAVFVAIFALHEVVCHYLPGAAWPDPSERRLDLLAGGLVSFFVFSMARTSRLHEALLARMREKYLEQCHLADLGSVAAAAVHEISSPLATLAVALGELRTVPGSASEQQALLEVMGRQIDGCKHIASRLLAVSGQERAESGGRMPADRFVAGIVEKCRLMQPWMALEHRASPARPVPEVMGDRSIEQAVLVLLHSSPGTLRQVELAHSWDARHLKILLSDYGPVSSVSADEAGGTPLFAAQPPPQSKHFDLLMAKAAIERFGGRIDCRRHSEGCFCMELSIPLPNQEMTTRLHAA